MLKKLKNILKSLPFNKKGNNEPLIDEIYLSINDYHLKMPKDMLWAFEGGDYYEKNVVFFLDKIINLYQDPIFIDIGANYGYYSIKYATNCKKIFSFEPVSNTFKVFTENINMNNIENIIAFQNGLSNIKEQKIINLYNSSGNNSIYERDIPEEHPLKKIGSETIQLLVLDDLVKNKQVEIPNILKIDVEGAELNVLLGAKEIISKYRPTVLLEYSVNTSIDAGYSRDILLKTLDLSDYNVYGIPEEPSDFTLINDIDFVDKEISNLIFLPKELNLIN